MALDQTMNVPRARCLWVCTLQALEQDLADLKERADAADSLQKQLQGVQEALAKSGAEQQALQQELAQCKEHVARLEFDLHGKLSVLWVAEHTCTALPWYYAAMHLSCN